ncbi:hypothetical protein MMC13_005073 [Lambiella insularis]|nr:hypothetical protein [Lambiella insularis]
MAAQASNGFEDRAFTLNILYISDSGGDTEILLSDNDDEEEGGGGRATEGENANRHETTFEGLIDGGQIAVQSLHNAVPAVPDSPKFAVAPSPAYRHSAPSASLSTGFRNGSATRSPFKNVPRWSIRWEKRNKVPDFDSLADHESNFGTQKTEVEPRNAIVGIEQRQRTEPTIFVSEQQQQRVDREVQESLDNSWGQLPSQQPSIYPSQDFSAIFERLASATEQQSSPPPESPSLGDSLRTIQTLGPHVETRSGVNISDITIVRVVARQDTPEGRKYLATGEIWLPLDAFGTSSLRGLCQAYDVDSARTDRLATLRKRTEKAEEVTPAQTRHQKRIKLISCMKHK